MSCLASGCCQVQSAGGDFPAWFVNNGDGLSLLPVISRLFFRSSSHRHARPCFFTHAWFIATLNAGFPRGCHEIGNESGTPAISFIHAIPVQHYIMFLACSSSHHALPHTQPGHRPYAETVTPPPLRDPSLPTSARVDSPFSSVQSGSLVFSFTQRETLGGTGPSPDHSYTCLTVDSADNATSSYRTRRYLERRVRSQVNYAIWYCKNS